MEHLVIRSLSLLAHCMTPDQWVEVGRMLRARREALGESREVMAKRAKVSRSTLQDWEAGGRTAFGSWRLPSPTPSTVTKIARAYMMGEHDLRSSLGLPATHQLSGSATLGPATSSAQGVVVGPASDELDEVRRVVERVDARAERIESLLDELAAEVRALRSEEP